MNIPPHSIEAEQSALGCALLDPQQAMTELMARFGEDDDVFFDGKNATIFHALRYLYNEGIPINTISLVERLKAMGSLEVGAGGIAYVSSLMDASPAASSVDYFAQVIEEKAMLRKMIGVCQNALTTLYNESEPVSAVLSQIEREILSVRRTGGKETPSMKELVVQAVDEFERLFLTQGKIGGLSTGLPDLDALTDGLHPNEMIVIAGYPGSGKSAIAMNIAECVAMDQRLPVGIFSLEMSAKRLVMRLMSSRARVNARKVKNGEIEEGEFNRLTCASLSLRSAPFQFCDLSDMSISKLRAKARQMIQAADIKLLVIDYLQLMTGATGKDTSREQEVAAISRGIKQMATEFQIPVIVLSQLNDDGKLRESRAIGQDADAVWVLKTESQDGDVAAVSLDIRKQREGPAPSVVKLTFLKSIVRFESAAL